MAATKTLQYRVGMDIGELRRNAEEAGTATRAFKKELADLEEKQRANRKSLEDVGKGMALFGGAVVAGLGLAAKAAMDWESAFTGVRKTVDGSNQQLSDLEGQLRQLARTMPTTHEEIAAVAESAGQLGIKRQDIVAFTKTMIDLGNSTNLTADEASTYLAQFSNIMGTSASDVDRLGSSLVALGNDGASTEKDIMEMGLRIAGAGHQIGLTEAQVLGIASALSSVGINAESGGSSISTTMIKIATAVTTGSSKLEMFAKVAGTTGQDFAARWRADPAAALTDFIGGLDKMQKRGEDVFTVLKDMGLNTIQVRDALLRASGAASMFAHSIDVGSTSWAENTALTNEANKRYQTTASQLAVAGNQVKDAMIDVGAAVVPMVSSVTGGIADIVKGFQSMPGPIKNVITYIGVAVGGITGIGGAALIAAPKIMNFRDSMSKMAAEGGQGSKILAGFGNMLIGPLGAALAAGTVLLGIWAEKQGEAAARVEETKRQAKGIADAITEANGAINRNVVATAAQTAAQSGLLEASKKLGIESGKVTEAILGQGDAYDTVMRAMGEQLKKVHDADAMREIVNTMQQLALLHEQTKKGVEANNAAKTATDKNAASQKELAKTAGLTTEQIKAQNDALDDLVKQFDKLGGNFLNTREAERSLIKTTQESVDMLKKNGATLDVNTQKGFDNQEQLDKQAKAFRDMAKAAEEEAAGTGGATAGMAALSASLTASAPKLVEIAEGFGMSKAEAEKYAVAVLSIPEPDPTIMSTPNSEDTIAELMRVRDAVTGIPKSKTIDVGVLTETAIAKLEALGYKIVRLPNGHVEVTGNTMPAQTALDAFISRNQGRVIGVRIETSYSAGVSGGKYYESGLYAYGGIHRFAGGGIEDHRPQIARAARGMVRMWAEPDTVAESYIPWAADRRREATGVLATTADNFGYVLAPKGPEHVYGPGGRGGNSYVNTNNVNISPGVITSRLELQTLIVQTVDQLKRNGRWNG